MTISSTSNRMDYTGNGATATYPYTFKIFIDADLLVTQRDADDVETTLILNTDYTVTGAGNTNGGSVVLIANLVNGYHLTLRRVRTLTQGTDIRNQGDFYPEVHENAFDHFIMVDQQQQNEIGRSAKLPETVTGVDATLPIPIADTWPGWNSAGTALENKTAASLGTITIIGNGLDLTGTTLSVSNPVRQAIAAGTVNAITATFTPAVASLTNNLECLVECGGANTSTTPTFAPDGLTAKTIVKANGVVLQLGDIAGANFKAYLIYDLSLDKWILQNPVLGRSLYAVGGGSVNAYTAAFTPPFTAYYAGLEINVLIPTGNTVNNPTINIDGLGTKTIQRKNSVTLNAADDMPTNHIVHLVYNGSSFDLLNPWSPLDASITAVKATALLGTWATGTKNSSTQAATDLLIVVDCDWSSASANGYVICKTDAANPPTNIKSVATCSNVGVSRNTCFLPVKKGHYYLVSETVTGGTPVISLYVIPLGS